MIPRIYDQLENHLQPNRVLVIYGPRRVGKTTLLRHYLSQTKYKYKLDSGENVNTQQILSSRDFKQILRYASGYSLLAIDEAQYIPNIGMGLKILVDQIPGILIIATGSSSFDLSGQIGEPLTGRKKTITLYPLSQLELSKTHTPFELEQKIEDFLIFGSYPKVYNARNDNEKRDILTDISQSYLFKDLLALESIRYTKTLVDLVKLLAFQVGSLVSFNELATQLSIDVKTVERYLDLLEKCFIIVSLSSLRRNLRNEIRGKAKYYFLDNGIRNAVVAAFNPLSLRSDVGQLWENFVFSERLKTRSYSSIYANSYYWRTYTGEEIDLIEEKDGGFNAFEFKWSKKAKHKHPKSFIVNYKNATYKTITPENYLVNFLIPETSSIQKL